MARKYIKTFTISATLDTFMLKTVGALYGLIPTKKVEAVKLVSICPHDQKPVKQLYVCEDGHQHVVSKLAKAREYEKSLIPLTPEEVEDLKENDLPSDRLNITVFDAETIHLTDLHQQGNTYVFVPDSTDEHYDLLVSVARAAQGKYHLLGRCNLRGHEHTIGLVPYGEGLAITQYVVGVNDIPTPSASLFTDPDFLVGLMDDAAKVFDADEFVSVKAQKIEQIIANRNGNPLPIPTPTPTPVSQGPSIADQMLAMAQARKVG